MTQDINDIIESYLIKYPTKSRIDLATQITEDDAIDLSVRSIRRYVSEVRDRLAAKALIAVPPMLVVPDGTTAKFRRQPKILVLDIETARMIVGVWRIGKVGYLGPDQVIKDWFMYGYSAKWLFDSKYISDFVTPQESLDRDDTRISKSLWHLMEEADIIITHNGNNFDLPKIKTRFLLAGLPPVSPYVSLDTLKAAKKEFGFSSNALNYIGTMALSRQKLHTDYQLWLDCEAGDPKALKYMEEYCEGDVGLLEEVYLVLRPWIHSHPNLAVLMDTDHACCPNCGGFELTTVGSYYTTNQNIYDSVRCDSCGALNRTKKSNINSSRRKIMTVPAAR